VNEKTEEKKNSKRSVRQRRACRCRCCLFGRRSVGLLVFIQNEYTGGRDGVLEKREAGTSERDDSGGVGQKESGTETASQPVNPTLHAPMQARTSVLQ